MHACSVHRILCSIRTKQYKFFRWKGGHGVPSLLHPHELSVDIFHFLLSRAVGWRRASGYASQRQMSRFNANNAKALLRRKEIMPQSARKFAMEETSSDGIGWILLVSRASSHRSQLVGRVFIFTWDQNTISLISRYARTTRSREYETHREAIEILIDN
ncbi:hypothetical protein HN011_005273 [Eciton burchellii]|nr:hypothetical protein HN011_005273 [Eciton burchellii]